MEELDEDDEVCIGKRCFARPHRFYVPPPHFDAAPSGMYKWKLGIKYQAVNHVLVKFQRALVFPDCLGLSDDARWRWQWHPLSLVLGIRIAKDDWKLASTRTFGVARIKSLSPFCGKLALRPVVDLFPVPALSLRRTFDFAGGEVRICGRLEASCSSGAQWRINVDWETESLFRILVQQGEESVSINYSKRIEVTKTCHAASTGELEFPLNSFCKDVARSLPVRLKIASIKVAKMFRNKTGNRKLPLLCTWLGSLKKSGDCDRITVVPGHWIDPGDEPGAPGEREFNLEVANVLERQLCRNGWQVLRPDRDAPNLSWEDYLDWVSAQSLKGTPVLEIHGQGSNADYRGIVLGVIGEAEAPLSRELSKDFGVFDMDWTDLAVPRRGGIILESFNSDEVLEMAPWHRSWAVRQLANKIAACIERASYENRAARGAHIKDTARMNPGQEYSEI